jgi:hypothetical protein
MDLTIAYARRSSLREWLTASELSDSVLIDSNINDNSTEHTILKSTSYIPELKRP